MACRGASENGLKTMRKILQFMTDGTGFDQCLKKINIVSASKGRCVAELVVDEEHLNRGGSLHGGFTATAVDVLTTCALISAGDNVPPGVSVDLHVSYMKAARPGDTVVFDSSALKLGKTLAYLLCNVTNKETGHLLVTGNHTKFIGSK